MRRLRVNIFLLVFIVANAIIWWNVRTYMEKRTQTELDAFTQTELAIVQGIARATKAWLTLHPKQTNGTSQQTLEQEVQQLFLIPVELGGNKHAWMTRNGYLIFNGRPSFPDSYLGKKINQVYAAQKQKGASHYQRIVSGILQGNEDADWLIWSHKLGPEYAAWTSIKIGEDVWSIGISSPESEILASPALQQELSRSLYAGITESALSLALLILLLHTRSSAHQHIDELESDISDRATVETALRESENRYRRLFTHSKAIQLIIEGGNGKIIDANAAATSFYGYPKERMQRMSLTNINALPAQQLEEEILDAKEEERNYYSFKHRLASGQIRDVEMYTTAMRLRDKNLLYAIIHDVTERRQMEEEIKRLGSHDVLTGLPNRSLLADRLAMACQQADRHNHSVAVLFLDLDGFKPINDTLGHLAGDELLRLVTQRLQFCVRKADTVARFGGDEFVVVSAELNSPEDVITIADKILTTLSHPYDLGGYQAGISASIGIAIYPRDAEAPEQLLIEADKAMYMAKESGKGRYHFIG